MVFTHRIDLKQDRPYWRLRRGVLRTKEKDGNELATLSRKKKKVPPPGGGGLGSASREPQPSSPSPSSFLPTQFKTVKCNHEDSIYFLSAGKPKAHPSDPSPITLSNTQYRIFIRKNNSVRYLMKPFRSPEPVFSEETFTTKLNVGLSFFLLLLVRLIFFSFFLPRIPRRNRKDWYSWCSVEWVRLDGWIDE